MKGTSKNSGFSRIGMRVLLRRNESAFTTIAFTGDNRGALKSKTWLILFPLTVLLIFGIVAALNVLVDPFGLFGDPIFDWYEYNYTNNHRLSKIAYLDRNWREYDSYIIGSSVAGTIPSDKLGDLMDAKFFNLFGNGGDMRRSLNLAQYVLENYRVRNIVLVISINDGTYHDMGASRLTHYMPAWVDGSPAIEQVAQYTEYLLADPRYALNKLSRRGQITFLPQVFDTCLAYSGDFNRTGDDGVPVVALEKYWTKAPWNTADQLEKRTLWHIDKCADDLAYIAALCKERLVNLIVVFPPYYDAYLQATPVNQQINFLKKLALATDFWDFSYTSISMDPRYFYDLGHFRSSVADMMLARIFGDTSVYLPEDFGFYVTAENVEEYVAHLSEPPPVYNHETALPILAWDLLGQEQLPAFEGQVAALKDAGYSAISFSQAVDYVTKGDELPDKPIIITIGNGAPGNDDGMLRVLEKYGMYACSFASGDVLGKTPRDQSDAAFVEAFRRDYSLVAQTWMQRTGSPVVAYGFKPGEQSKLANALLTEMGVSVTLVEAGQNGGGVNTLVQGVPQSLLQLELTTIGTELSPADLLAFVGGLTG